MQPESFSAFYFLPSTFQREETFFLFKALTANRIFQLKVESFIFYLFIWQKNAFQIVGRNWTGANFDHIITKVRHALICLVHTFSIFGILPIMDCKNVKRQNLWRNHRPWRWKRNLGIQTVKSELCENICICKTIFLLGPQSSFNWQNFWFEFKMRLTIPSTVQKKKSIYGQLWPFNGPK